MTAVRLLALDLDGTLLDSNRRLRPSTCAALAAAAGRGVTLALVTGRSVGAARHYRRLLSRATRHPWAMAACNGAVILRPDGEPVGMHPLPPPLLLPALETLREYGLVPSCYTRRGIVLDQPWRHLSDLTGGTERVGGAGLWAAFTFARVNRIRPVRDLCRWAERRREPVFKIFAYSRAPDAPGRLQAAAAALADRLPSLHATSSGTDNLELTGPGVHKGRALRTLCHALHIPREAVLAVGDGLNDQEMLMQAGTGVAMGNGAPELKSAAAWVAPSCDEDGVVATIRRYILGDG